MSVSLPPTWSVSADPYEADWSFLLNQPDVEEVSPQEKQLSDHFRHQAIQEHKPAVHTQTFSLHGPQPTPLISLSGFDHWLQEPVLLEPTAVDRHSQRLEYFLAQFADSRPSPDHVEAVQKLRQAFADHKQNKHLNPMQINPDYGYCDVCSQQKLCLCAMMKVPFPLT